MQSRHADATVREQLATLHKHALMFLETIQDSIPGHVVAHCSWGPHLACRWRAQCCCRPTLPTLVLVFGQACDWGGVLQHRMGSMDGPRVGRAGTNKFRNPPGTHVSQRTGRMALDLRSGNRNGSASPLGWRDLQPRGGQHRCAR